MHHPFTMPFEEDIDLIWNRIREQYVQEAYDIVLNGTEIGGGSVSESIRMMYRKQCFSALGFTNEKAHEQFGFLLDAFKYGVPPHAGLAYGLDRLVMLNGKRRQYP